MIKLVDILKSNEHALYYDTRYGVAEQSMGGMVSPQTFADASLEGFKWVIENRHIILDIIEIAAAIVIPPPAGLIISSAIGLAHAGMYLAEGEKEEAGLYVLFAMLPGVPAGARKLAPNTVKTISKFLETGNKKVLAGLDKASIEIAESVFKQVGKLGKGGVAKLLREETRNALLKNARNIAHKMVSSSELTPIINKIPQLSSKIKLAAQNVLETAIRSTLKTSYGITKLGLGAIAVYNIAALYRYLYDQHIRVGDTEAEYMKKLEALDNFTSADLGSTAEYFASVKLNQTQIEKFANDVVKNWQSQS
jgi:hypothetical protein